MLARETTFERHYSVEELTELWGMSDDFVRRLFLNEAGVVVFFKQQPGKRVYRTLRIPESIVQRVHRRMRRDECHDGVFHEAPISVRTRRRRSGMHTRRATQAVPIARAVPVGP
jgi:hypothetical protein